jgi:hypothetical protein
MRRLALVIGAVAVLAVSAAPAYSAVRPPSGAKPAWTHAAAFGRSWEWARYDWPGLNIEYPNTCNGPYENGHGKTQWACYGVWEFAESWQVNIDAYGEQTYHALH